MNKHVAVLLALLFVLVNCVGCWDNDPPKPEPTYPRQLISVAAGGVAGWETMLEPQNSNTFRSMGGVQFAHGWRWQRIPDEQRKALRNVWGPDIVAEVGYSTGPHGTAFAQRVKTFFLDYGFSPRVINLTCQAGGQTVHINEYKEHHQKLLGLGLSPHTLVLPIFEYQNYHAQEPALGQGLLPRHKELIRYAKGATLDVPARFYYHQNDGYRSFVMQLAEFVTDNGYTLVWIASPHFAGNSYETQTHSLLKEFRANGSTPHWILFENYRAEPPAGYINVVGDEDTPNTQLGAATYFIDSLFPHLNLFVSH